MSKHKITGYHGTTQSSSQTILAEQQFKESTRSNDWLGTGAYFFAYKEHAQQWTSHSRYNGIPTTILEADLEYTQEQLLDLDDPQRLADVEEVVKEAISLSTSSDNPTTAHLKSEQETWCFACNLFRSLVPEIGITIYTFSRKVMPYSRLRINQRQICVSDPSIITGIRIAQV